MSLEKCLENRHFKKVFDEGAFVIITKWQAPIVPTKEQIKLILESEGLEPYEESFEPQLKVKEHRHPFCEVRVIVAGELLFSVSGNQFLLRAGDKIEIPANTKHSHSNQGECLCVCAQRAI